MSVFLPICNDDSHLIEIPHMTRIIFCDNDEITMKDLRSAITDMHDVGDDTVVRIEHDIRAREIIIRCYDFESDEQT
ncbi:MAG: hypothetical protein WC284_12225 [Candidimonas sp.]